MKPRYHVVTVYEGRCPTCGQYQNSQLSSDNVDKECSECRRKKVTDALINKEINIYDIVGNELIGFTVYIESNHKIYTIKATEFKEGIK